MNWRKTIILALALSAAGTLAAIPGVSATLQTYRCADDTQFIVAFCYYDTRADMQIDGRAVTLAKRLALSGSRYSGGSVTLKITHAGTTVMHARRPVTACELA